MFELLITLALTLATLWIEFWTESAKFKKSQLQNRVQSEKSESKNKRKRKLIYKVCVSLIMIIGFFISYKSFQKDEIKSNEKLQRELNQYKLIDTVKQVSLLANKNIDAIKTKSDSIIFSLDSLSSAYKNRLSLLDSNLDSLNTHLNTNVKLTENAVSNLMIQTNRIQYPIPKEIKVDFTLYWSVLGVSKSFDQVVKQKKKRPIDYINPYGRHENFLIDTGFSSYPFLYLAHKNIYITFKKNGQTAKYQANIWPSDIIGIFQTHYPSYELNIYRHANFIFNNDSKSISLQALQCPFTLVSVSSKINSVFDIDSSICKIEINPGYDDIRNVLSVEAPPDYIFGYSQYNANDGVKTMNKESIALKMNFNGMFNVNYSTLSKTNSLVFQIDNFKLINNL